MPNKTLMIIVLSTETEKENRINTAKDNLMPRTFAAIASGTFYYLSSSLFLFLTPLAAVRTGTRSGSPQWRSREYCYCVLQAFK